MLSGLYYKYSKFKPNAYPNFLVNNNGVVTDKYVGGVWQNPYIDHQVFAIAAPILIYKSLSLQVTLPASLWYTNQATSVQSIAIDFGNGAGYQTMTFGQVRTINYVASGLFEWKYKLILTDSQILYGHSKLKIDIPVFITPPTGGGTAFAAATIPIPPPASCTAIATIPFTGTRQYLGVANSATLQVRYRNSDCIIRRPLIIVEGFDSGILGVENPFGENDLFRFSQTAFDETGNLASQIINKDIIYINFNKGRDDLKRNAYLVEDIIKWVNTRKAQAGSTTPNIVIGQSMGGVIARYALRDMEILEQAHQTSIFVSHDAPHQGANIPLGVQYFARHLADQFVSTPLGDYQIEVSNGNTVSIEDLKTLFESQGTKQLLSNYIDSSFNLNNTVFNTFQTELRTMGYPIQTRNVALSNGNHCAVPQDLQPSATVFSLNGGASQTAIATVLTTYLQPITAIGFGYLAYELNEPGLLLGILPGSSSFDMDFKASALPNSNSSIQIYSGSISYTKKIFSLFGWNPQITTTLTDRSYNNPVNLSMDSYPGGNYSLPLELAQPELSPFLQSLINLNINVYLAPSFNFIPSTSALDIGGGATTLIDSDFRRKYNSLTPPTGNLTSPFVNFTTSVPNTANINEPHISFNLRNGNWLATELDISTTNNQVFDCGYVCNETQITGANILCTNSTFTVPNIAGVTYNWTVTQGASLVTLSGNGTSTFTLTTLPNSGGSLTVSCTIASENCGSRILTKKIWVGPPNVGATVRLYPEIQIKNKVCFFSNVSGVSLAQQGVIFKANPGLNGNYCFTGFLIEDLDSFTISNICGSTTFTPDYANNREVNSSENSKFFKIYPNPATNIVNIDLKNQDLKPISNTEINAELYNMIGEIKGNVKITNNIALIYTLGLPKGIYVLKIVIDGVTESHQVAIQ